MVQQRRLEGTAQEVCFTMGMTDVGFQCRHDRDARDNDVDRDHTYDQSIRDFRNVNRFLEVGGFIIFDDSADDSDWEINFP